MNSLLPADLVALATRVITANAAAGRTVAVAESCTGGLVAAALTEIPGSSAVLDRGFVTYSNAAKTQMLDVSEDLIDCFGAVSVAVAWAMAQGALAHSQADVAVAITGIAGPGGGSAQKPVGLVHFACARREGDITLRERRFGPLTRADIRAGAVLEALAMLRASVATAVQRRP